MQQFSVHKIGPEINIAGINKNSLPNLARAIIDVGI